MWASTGRVLRLDSTSLAIAAAVSTTQLLQGTVASSVVSLESAAYWIEGNPQVFRTPNFWETSPCYEPYQRMSGISCSDKKLIVDDLSVSLLKDMAAKRYEILANLHF